MSTTATSSLPDSICANCGKGEENSGDLKACTACKMVKYCNRDCQIAHRPQHKKACRKRAAELYDEQLFKQPQPREECPICMLTLPHESGTATATFESCCGKLICNGCIYTMRETGGKNMELCPFCKTPPANSDKEEVKRVKKLMEKGNANAFYHLAGNYATGTIGLPQNQTKAIESWLKAGELGCANAYYNLGIMYSNGRGAAIDKKKARHYYELAAMNGDVEARHNLSCMEGQTGNYKRAMKHVIISASAGYKPSLDLLKQGYMSGYITKDQYANALREYQESQDEMKSDARDKAVAAIMQNQQQAD